MKQMGCKPVIHAVTQLQISLGNYVGILNLGSVINMFKHSKPNVPQLFQRVCKKDTDPKIYIKDVPLASTGFRRVITATTPNRFAAIDIMIIREGINIPMFRSTEAHDHEYSWCVNSAFAKSFLNAEHVTRSGEDKDEVKLPDTTIKCNKERALHIDEAFAKEYRKLKFYPLNPDWKFLMKACAKRDNFSWAGGISFGRIRGERCLIASDGRRAHFQNVRVPDDWLGLILDGQLVDYIKSFEVEMAIWDYPWTEYPGSKPLKISVFRIARNPDTFVMGSMLDMNFPDFEKLFPDGDPLSEIDSEKVRTRLMPKNKSHSFLKYCNTVIFDGSEMRIEVRENQHATFKTWLPYPVTNGNSIKINGKYLLDMIDYAPGTMEFYGLNAKGKDSPVVYESNDGKYSGLLMPVIVKDESKDKESE